MKINIKATGIELTQAVKDYVEKKVNSLTKYIEKGNASVVVEVEVGRSTKHHKSGDVFMAEVHISGAGLDLYAVSEEPDLYAAIDLVKDEIAHSLVQLKGKQETMTRKGGRMIKNMMKGLTDTTVKGFSWGVERMKFKSFKKRS